MIRFEFCRACFGYSIHGECSVVEVDIENSGDLAVVVASRGITRTLKELRSVLTQEIFRQMTNQSGRDLDN